MASTRWGTRGSSPEIGSVHNPRFAIPVQRVPLIPPIDVSVPPPPFPLIRGLNPLATLPSLNLILPPCPPPLPINHTLNLAPVVTHTSETLTPLKPSLPLLLVRHNEKYTMKFNNCELLPQYLIEEDLWHRFGVLSCSVVIERSTDTGAPITDNEVHIHFNELSTAEDAFKELTNVESYWDLHFREECVPPSEAIEAIEVSQSLDHFYCLTFKDEGQVNWDIQQLKEVFSTYGHVANVNKDKLGNIYVRYSEKRSAQLALFHLGNDPLIHLKNARNLKEKGPPANTNTGGSPTVKKVCVSKGGSDHSNAGDDSASTASADLSMLEMKMIENAFISDLSLLD